jgi:flagella basal body P-ring formation protein FlgA
MRKRIQVLVAVVLLAWATQTLLHQWGFGAEIPVDRAVEKFVPGTDRYIAGATLEMRGDATIVGAEVRLKQVCRWSDADAQVFVPVADLVVMRLSAKSPYRAITVDQIRSTLHDAGVNLGVVKFSGPTSCTIGRSDTSFDERNAIREWAAAKGNEEVGAETPRHEGTKGDAAAPAPAAPLVAPVSVAKEPVSQVKTLRELLVDDLSVRTGVPGDQLQVNFNPKDENLLHMSEPLFKFNIDGRLVRDLGEVTWNIQILTGNGASQKGTVAATARAWQNQVTVAKALGYHQVIRAGDVEERRVLVDRLPGEPLLTSSQIVGQEAARDLRAGTVVSARMVDALPMVKTGQLVNVSLTVGSVKVKTVGRALESGCFGQAVKVRNEATQDVYEVTMIAPQEGTIGPAGR